MQRRTGNVTTVQGRTEDVTTMQQRTLDFATGNILSYRKLRDVYTSCGIGF